MRGSVLLCCLVAASEAPRADRRRLAAYNYEEVVKLTKADANAKDYFGNSVAIDGGTVVIGAYGNDNGNPRSRFSYVFRTSDGGATYDHVTKLTAGKAARGDRSGCSVAIDGNTVVVGAYLNDDDGYNSGSAYVYRTSDDWDTYVELAKLTAADAAAYDYFGKFVAIDGDTIVIAAYGDDDDGSKSGSVYVFDANAPTSQPTSSRPTSSPTTSQPTRSPAPTPRPTPLVAYNYLQVAKLTAHDPAAGDEFGTTVAIAGDTIVVGNSGDGYTETYSDGRPLDPMGAVYIFRSTDGGATYVEVAKLTASDAADGDNFGGSVAIDGSTVVVGAYNDDDGGTSSGAAYVFDANAPTSQPTTRQPTTSEPTSRPTTSEPTSRPTTSEPTSWPTTSSAPTTTPTSQPTHGPTTTAPTVSKAEGSGGGNDNSVMPQLPPDQRRASEGVGLRT